MLFPFSSPKALKKSYYLCIEKEIILFHFKFTKVMDYNKNQQQTTTMVMLPQTEWEGVKTDLQELKELVRAKSDEELNSQWIESTQARQLLGVSQKTWQHYRDARIIPFTQVGRKIYVKRGDLNKFMQDHYINSK